MGDLHDSMSRVALLATLAPDLDADDVVHIEAVLEWLKDQDANGSQDGAT